MPDRKSTLAPFRNETFRVIWAASLISNFGGLIQSVGAADIPVMAAYLLLIALVFVTINLIVDLLYYAVDPRLRVGGGAARGH